MQNDAPNSSEISKAAVVETAVASDVPVSSPAPAAPEPAVSPAPSMVESKNRESPLPNPNGASANNPGSDLPLEPQIPEDSLRFRYEVFLAAGREQVLRVKSMIEFPMALDLENLAQTDVNFPDVLDRILIQPVTTKFRAYLQKRFEAASQAEAERVATAKPPPPSMDLGFKLPKPTSGTEFTAPEIPVKPPTPRMPGYVPRSRL